MGNPGKGWTPERRKKQSEAIRRWKPWSKSTGPKSAVGKAAVAGNAWAGGHLVQLRQFVKEMNKTLKEQKDCLK